MVRLIIILLFITTQFAHASDESKVSEIVIYKSERTMQLLAENHTILKTYRVALGGNPVGPKTQSGDEKTPEGRYYISAKNEKSRFHLALRVSYPNDADRAQAKARGVDPGGDIMIHGMRNWFGWIGSWHLWFDTWTDGCIAVTDHEIEEIWALVDIGTPIDIRP